MPQLVWLITGCSSGFGLQFTHSILSRGDLVIATARTPSSITHLSDLPGVSVLQLDITSPQDTLNATMARAIAIHGRIDVLLNNAGHVQIGLWEDLAYADWTRQFETNVFGTIKVTKALLPHLRERGQGTMVFVSSLNGFVGHPGAGAYSASKHALEGAVEALANETSPLGLKTLLIEPGRFRTKLLSTANLKVNAAGNTTNTTTMDTTTSNPHPTPDPVPDFYATFYQQILPAIAHESGRQPGDPTRLAAIVLDLVRGEGVAEGKEVPLRMFLGNDAVDEVGAKLRRTVREMEAWEDVGRSTDFGEAEG